jgi:uncharacterized protein YebE (UPF0316 family)
MMQIFFDFSSPTSPYFFLFIFCSRVADVSLGTLRSVLAAKGQRKIVPFIGFFEVIVWLFAVSQILKNLTNIWGYLAWAGGYALGIYIGLLMEEKLAIGNQVIRIITQQKSDEFLQILTQRGIGYTVLDGQGARGPVNLIFTIVKRKEVGNIIDLLQGLQPNAFYSVEDVKSASSTGYKGVKQNPYSFFKFFPLSK